MLNVMITIIELAMLLAIYGGLCSMTRLIGDKY